MQSKSRIRVTISLTKVLFYVAVRASTSEEKMNISLKRVRDFLDSFPNNQIAKSSLKCNNYARALLHYEQHMGRDNIQDHLDTLQVCLGL